jgi:hypothetical protein
MMRRIFKLITFSFFIAISCTGYCQNKFLFKERIKGQIIDTLEINDNKIMVRALWMADTLKITMQDQAPTFDFEAINKTIGDKHAIRTEKARQTYIKIMKFSGQNCYAYALEKYFSCNDLSEQTIFNKRTWIDGKAIHQVVDNCFEEILSFPTQPKRNLKMKLPDNVLLTFINKSDWIIHAMYYSKGIFYTKNGVLEASEFVNLKKFLKENYWDTKTIKVYQFDKTRLNLSLNP